MGYYDSPYYYSRYYDWPSYRYSSYYDWPRYSSLYDYPSWRYSSLYDWPSYRYSRYYDYPYYSRYYDPLYVPETRSVAYETVKKETVTDRFGSRTYTSVL